MVSVAALSHSVSWDGSRAATVTVPIVAPVCVPLVNDLLLLTRPFVAGELPDTPGQSSLLPFLLLLTEFTFFGSTHGLPKSAAVRSDLFAACASSAFVGKATVGLGVGVGELDPPPQPASTRPRATTRAAPT